MDLLSIILLCVASLEFVIIVCFIFKAIKIKRDKRVIYEKDNVRYTISDKVKNQEGNVNATFKEKDTILIADKAYHVSKTGEIKPGRYDILSTQTHKSKITLNVNGISRNQEHNSGIIFAEGDVVVAENDSIILR